MPAELADTINLSKKIPCSQARKCYTKTPERTKYYFETSWYIGVTIANQVGKYEHRIWVYLPLCFMREVACLSETMLCFINSSLALC